MQIVFPATATFSTANAIGLRLFRLVMIASTTAHFRRRWLWRVRPVGRHSKSPKDNEPRQCPYRQGDTECYVFHVDFELVQTAMFGANIISVAPSWTQSSVTSTAARAAPEKLESKSLCSNKRINGLCAPVDFCSSFSWRRPSCEPSSSTFPMTPSQPCILC